MRKEKKKKKKGKELRYQPLLHGSFYNKGPVHTKTIVNANFFYAFRPSVHTRTMETLTVNS